MNHEIDVKKLKKIMVEKDVSNIAEMVRISGVSRTTMTAILKKGVRPSTDIILKIANSLEINAEDAGSIFFNQELTQNARNED